MRNLVSALIITATISTGTASAWDGEFDKECWDSAGEYAWTYFEQTSKKEYMRQVKKIKRKHKKDDAAREAAFVSLEKFYEQNINRIQRINYRECLRQKDIDYQRARDQFNRYGSGPLCENCTEEEKQLR